MAQEKEYFAFISYQRKDEEWADRLRNKLEHYRLPSSVRKQDASLPKEIRPIFRDALELAGGVLAKEIETALQQSKFLIVICSPNSANSPWVNKEIKTFIDLGREDHIIPFIIDGTPFSDKPDTECFPPALRSLKGEKELLGININEISRDAACIKVVSRMFGLKFDTLWQRYERELRRKRWTWIGGAVLFALLGIGIGGYFVRQNTIIESQNERLQQDSVTMVEHLTRIQNDSIRLSEKNDSIFAQTALIQEQRDSLFSATNELMVSNRLLAEERDNVLRNQARHIARQIDGLIDAGDFYTAQKLSLEIVGDKYPFTPEAAAAIIKSTQGKNALFHGHSDNINDINISPDGKKIVSASKDGTIRLWNIENGATKFFFVDSIYGRPIDVKYAEFSPNGQLIVSCGETGVKIWGITTGECIQTINDNMTHALFWSEEIIIVYNFKERRLYNSRTGKYLESFLKDEKNIRKISFSPDRSLLLTLSSDNCAKVWDIKSLRCVKKFVHDSDILDSHFNRDNSLLVSTCRGSIEIWDVKNEVRKNKIEQNPDKYYGIAFFSPNQKEIIEGKKVFSLNGELQTELKWGIFCDYSTSNNSIIGIGNNYKDLCILTWDDRSNSQRHLFNNIPSTIALFGIDDNQIISANDNSISIWNRKEQKCIKQIIMKNLLWDYPKSSLFLSKDRKTMVSTGDSIRIWRTDTWEPVVSFGLMNKTDNYLSAELSPDKKKLAIVSFNNSSVYDLHGDSLILSIYPNNIGNSWTTSAFSHQGKYVAFAGDNGIIKIFELNSGKCLYTIKDHPRSISYIEFSPNDQIIVSASWDNTIKLFSMRTGKCIRTLYGHNNVVSMVKFANRGLWLISTSFDKTIRVWDVSSGICIKTIFGNYESAVFSNDNRYILASSYDGIYLISFPSIQQIIKETRNRFKYNPLTPEERRKYYLE